MNWKKLNEYFDLHVEEGLYSIHYNNDKKYALTILETDDENETELRMTEWTNDERQLFFFINAYDGGFHIISYWNMNSIGIINSKCKQHTPLIGNTISFQQNYIWIKIEKDDCCHLWIDGNEMKIGIINQDDDLCSKRITLETDEENILDLVIEEHPMEGKEMRELFKLVQKASELLSIETYEFEEGIERITKKEM